RAYVRVLLWKRQPAFAAALAAALAAAEQDLSCPACTGGAVIRPWEVSDERSKKLLLLPRQMAGAPVLPGDLPPVLRRAACEPARHWPACRPSPSRLTGRWRNQGSRNRDGTG